MKYLIVVALFVITGCATSGDGTVRIESEFDVATTSDRLQSALTNKGMTVFTEIDHAAGARKAGLNLRPTRLVIFGNPKVGTPLMLCDQSVAIDLPQKTLIYEDVDGTVWLSYNDPAYLAQRHQLADCQAVLGKVSKALAKFAAAAARE